MLYGACLIFMHPCAIIGLRFPRRTDEDICLVLFENCLSKRFDKNIALLVRPQGFFVNNHSCQNA